MKRIILASFAFLLFSGSALATVGNPTESIYRNPTYQQILQRTEAQYSQDVWEKMSQEQKNKAIAQEKERLHKIGEYKYNTHESNTQ